ncbi:MAG: SpoIIE family protein phosphatase [Chloroflexi bacterium]|nr:SpoIIE family protein phosphatase [Chloroflexota bacterium]
MTNNSRLIADLQTLNQIAATLNSAVDTRSALDDSLAQLIALLRLETGWVFLRQPEAQERWDGRGYTLAAQRQLPPALARHNPAAWDKDCDCQSLCNKGKLTAAYNEVRCSRLADIAGDRGNLVVHASVPLRGRSEILGILNVAAPSWAAFDERALALLTNVGSQMGAALERARLYDMMHERRIHEQATLLRLSNQLLGRLDLDALLNYLVGEVLQLQDLDACAVLLPGPGGQNLYFRAASGWTSDPVGHGFRVPIEGSFSGQVMASQKPIVRESVPDVEDFPWVSDWFREEDFHAEVVIPMVAQGRSIGVLVIDARNPRQFDVADIRFLQLMANQAAIAIERVRLRDEEFHRQRIDEELAVARQIQLSLLPLGCPEIVGWEFTAVYEPARQVGGDFYDFFRLPGSQDAWGVVIADVADKGVPAALYMALSRTTIRNTALEGHPPAHALMLTNRYLQDDSRSDMFVSAFYGVLDGRDGRFLYANAGHNHPFIWRATTGQVEILDSDGIVLGVVAEIEMQEQQVGIGPGDVLVLYTDGLTEAVDGAYEAYGEGRLYTAVADILAANPQTSAEDLAAVLLHAVQSHAGDMAQFDDFTLVIIKRASAASMG